MILARCDVANCGNSTPIDLTYGTSIPRGWAQLTVLIALKPAAIRVSEAVVDMLPDGLDDEQYAAAEKIGHAMTMTMPQAPMQPVHKLICERHAHELPKFESVASDTENLPSDEEG